MLSKLMINYCYYLCSFKSYKCKELRDLMIVIFFVLIYNTQKWIKKNIKKEQAPGKLSWLRLGIHDTEPFVLRFVTHEKTTKGPLMR